MSDDDLDRLLSDPRVVRNGVKLRSVRENAAFLLDLGAEHGSAARLFADWPSERFAGLLELLKARGSRLGGLAGSLALRSLGKDRSEEHTSELQSLMRISYAVFCLKKKT